MAPERCFGYTYRNVIVASTENCQENQNGASRVGTGAGFGSINAADSPARVSAQSLIYRAAPFSSFGRPGPGSHTVQADGPRTAGFGAATTSPGPRRTARGGRQGERGGSSRPASRAPTPLLPHPHLHPECPGPWPETPSARLCAQRVTQETSRPTLAQFQSRP